MLPLMLLNLVASFMIVVHLYAKSSYKLELINFDMYIVSYGPPNSAPQVDWILLQLSTLIFDFFHFCLYFGFKCCMKVVSHDVFSLKLQHPVAIYTLDAIWTLFGWKTSDFTILSQNLSFFTTFTLLHDFAFLAQIMIKTCNNKLESIKYSIIQYIIDGSLDEYKDVINFKVSI